MKGGKKLGPYPMREIYPRFMLDSALVYLVLDRTAQTENQDKAFSLPSAREVYNAQADVY